MMNLYLKYLISKHKVISFDLFDTLLVRPYVKPKDVFKHLEEIYSVRGFAEWRANAEKVVCEKLNKQHATYDDIYAVAPNEYLFLKEKEYALEKETLFVNPLNLEIFNYAKKLHKYIIITSDMYYSSVQLDAILKEKGIFGYSKIFVSSEQQKAKWNGQMWEYIFENLSIHPKELLHIGDSLYSDILPAQRNHVGTYHVTAPIITLFKKNRILRKFYKNNSESLTASIIIGVILKSFITNKMPTHYWERFGYIFGGPMCYGLSFWLKEQVLENNLKEVLFVARDGYTIEKIFNILVPAIKTHYVYAPRSINLLTSLDYKNILPWQNKTASLLKLYKDIFPKFTTFIPQGKITLEEQTSVLKNNIDRLKPLSDMLFKQYQKYISGKKIITNNLGLFDISGGGFNSMKLLKKVFPQKNIKGFYWLTIGEEAQKCNFEVFSYQKDFNISLLNYDILEFLITAPELPIKYFNQAGKLVRIENKYEKTRANIYNIISNSEIAFTKDLLNAYGDYPVAFDWQILVELCNVFIKKASLFDYWYFRNIKHGKDEAHTEYVSILKMKKKLLKNILRKG